MALGVLNNISAIYAQNNLANTQASLSKTLQQLSSGSRINSGADDAAGLSLANGLQASATALSQSAKNAAEGVDFLQVADGALSQVTSLLNRAVTLATEAGNGTLNSSQQTAANSEYQKILGEINSINSNTEYNGISSFQSSALTAANPSNAIAVANNALTVTYGDGTTKALASGAGITDMASLATALSGLAGANGEHISASVSNGQLIISGGSVAGSVTETVMGGTASGQSSISVTSASDALKIAGAGGTDDMTLNYTKSDGSAGTATLVAGTSYASLSALATAINGAASGTSGNIATVSGNTLTLNGASLTANVTGVGALNETASVSLTNNKSVAIFTSDGNISASYNNAASDAVSTSSGSLSLSGTTLTDATSAQAALQKINVAISTVASDRGTIGANINTITAVGNVMTMQSTNTLAAQNDVTATDYGQATSDMSKYQILSQTGIAALSQANQSQQLITKLLQ